MHLRAVAVMAVGVTLILSACNSNEDAKNLTAATATPVQTGTAAAAETTAPRTAPASPPTAAPTATPTPPQGEIKLLESGFSSYTNSLSGYNIPWAAVVKNTSATQQATDTRVTALFYDASNVLLKSTDQTLALIFPGQTTAAGDSFLSQLPSIPARMEIRVSGTKWQTGKSALSLTVTDPAWVADRISPKITAKVTSPFDKDISNLKIVCIASAGDKYLAVGSSYLDLLPAATTAVANCSIDSRQTVAAGATVRLFVSLTSIASVGQ